MKKIIFLALFLIAILSYIFKIDELLVNKFSFLQDIKVGYIEKMVNISSSFEKYFNQANHIEKLQDENKILQEYKALYNITKSQLDALKELVSKNEIYDISFNIELARVFSYINFNDFTKVLLDKKPTSNKILGLISENYAAGIVINQDNKSVALLNGNKDCSYAVFIGESRSPGIIMALEKEEELQIKFIPITSMIKEGDEVITSGMDNIFYEGLKVGKVTEITELADMKIAKVKPYINATEKRYFYVFDSLNQERKEINNEP